MLETLLGLLASFAFLGGALGMARRKTHAPPDPLDQPRRRLILAALQRNPGANVSALCRELDAGWGTIQHHLQFLKRAGLVKSVMMGRGHQHYLPDQAGSALEKLALLKNGRMPELVEAILAEPGVLQRDLVARLAMHRKVIRRYLDLLKADGLIVETRHLRHLQYHATPALEALKTQVEPHPAAPEGPSGPARLLAPAPPRPF